MKIFAAFSLVLLLIIPASVQAQTEDDKSASSPMKQFEDIRLQDIDGNKITLKKLLVVKDFSKPGVLIFIADANEKVLDFARPFDLFVDQNKEEKGTSGAVIVFSKDNDEIAAAKKKLTAASLTIKVGVFAQLAACLDRIPKDASTKQRQLATGTCEKDAKNRVATEGDKAAEVYKMSKDKPVFVVTWNDSRIIVAKSLTAKELEDDDPVLSNILVDFIILVD